MTAKQRLLKLIEEKGKGITVIVGLSKNAGKTTLLNWLTVNIRTANMGVITTGRDGEEDDLLLGGVQETSKICDRPVYDNAPHFSKPKISLKAGTYFTTGTDVIRKQGVDLTLIEKLTCRAAGKPLWIVRAESCIETEIVGPPTVSEQIAVAQKLLDYGAEHVFVDGSFDRKAISASPAVQNLLLVAGSSAGDIGTISGMIANLEMLARIKTLSGEEDLGGEQEKLLRQERIVLINTGSQEGKTAPVYEAQAFDRLIGNEREIADKLKEGLTGYLFLPTSLTERSYRYLRHVVKQQQIRIIVSHPLNITLSNVLLEELFPLLLTVREMKITAIALNSFATDGKHLDCEVLRNNFRRDYDYPVVDVMEA